MAVAVAAIRRDVVRAILRDAAPRRPAIVRRRLGTIRIITGIIRITIVVMIVIRIGITT